jgi:RecA-family ATPase
MSKKDDINDKHFAQLSSVEPMQVNWLMEPLIPYGMTTIAEGDPGIGKSYLTMHIAAQVSVGGSLPNAPRIKKGRVLILSGEDDPAFTIRPRIDAMGGDPTMIRFQSSYASLDEDGLELLMKEVRRNPPSLIIIDPLFAYIPSGQDMYKPNVIRPLLAQLTEVAQYNETALLIVRHLTKSKRDKAIYQGAGSIDVIGAARSAFLVAQHPDDETIKVVAHIKHNLSERGQSWQYRLVQKDDSKHPILEWIGPTDLTAEDLLSPRDDHQPSALDVAIDFLRLNLKESELSAEWLQSEAATKSIALRTLDRAKDKIGIVVRKKGKRWFWALPET